MSCCTCLTKFGLQLINLLFLVAGGGLIVLGSIMIHGYTQYSGLKSLGMALLPAIIVMSVGVLALILGFFGCIATCKRNKCLHGMFFSVLLLMLLALIVGVILSLVYRSKIESGLYGVMNDSMQKYLDRDDVHAQVDLIQADFQCCGINGSIDWINTPWYQNHSTASPNEKYPTSCCVHQQCKYNDPKDPSLFKRGCYTLVLGEFQHYFKVIAASIGGFALILVIGLVLNCVLLAQKRKQEYNVPYVGLENEQQRHDGMRI